MDLIIGKRLREFRTRTGRKMSAVATATGIKTDTLYKWEKGTRPSNAIQYNTLLQYLDKMESSGENWINVESAQTNGHISSKPSFVQLSLRHPAHPIPVSTGHLSAGSITTINNEPHLIVNYIAAPFLDMADGAVDVIGDAMYPAYPNGSKVVIARLQDPALLVWGEVYCLIDKNWQTVLRRLMPGKEGDGLVLRADNPDNEKYPPILRHWDQIEAIFKIKACIVRM